MPLNVVVGSSEKPVVRGEVTKNGTQKRMIRIEAWDGSAWKIVQSFAPPMSLAVTPSVYGVGNSLADIAVTSNTATATPQGGTGPYTYAWSKVSGSNLTVISPNSASTTFRSTVGAGSSRTAIYRCTATDSHGLTATGDVDIYLVNIREP